MSTHKPLIWDLSLSEIACYLKGVNEPEYRAVQVWRGLYRDLKESPHQFTNLPNKLRQRLADEYECTGLLPVNTIVSNDGMTENILFELNDGSLIETVLMRYEKRRTLCISTQSGCAMGCVFCATGQMGFHRNLSSGEIVAQVLYFSRKLHKESEQVLTNIVVMGMGEPFHNYPNLMSALERLTDENGFGMGARRFTISTVGLIPMIHRFSSEHHQVNLAVSLHSVDDDIRSTIIPVNRTYPVDELLMACKDYVDENRRRITFEWALIAGVNDSLSDALSLGRKIKGLLCHVNLIRLNPTPLFGGVPTDQAGAENFKNILLSYGIPCSIRLRRGIEIAAGCGQLVGKYK